MSTPLSTPTSQAYTIREIHLISIAASSSQNIPARAANPAPPMQAQPSSALCAAHLKASRFCGRQGSSARWTRAAAERSPCTLQNTISTPLISGSPCFPCMPRLSLSQSLMFTKPTAASRRSCSIRSELPARRAYTGAGGIFPVACRCADSRARAYRPRAQSGI